MIGETISHYKILEELGAGGMGVVYKAKDLKLERLVAIKFLPHQTSTDESVKRRFIQEAKAASSLDHPNICTIHEIDETDDGRLFIVMGLYDGETLRHRMEGRAPDTDEALDITIQIASGLAKAHEKGITHRDIKPDNIFITNEGQVKILDFGLAKLGGQTRLTRTGRTLGTLMFMSPEQATGEDVDERSDIFSLGCVLYQLLSGQLPFTGDHDASVLYGIVNHDPKPLSDYRPDVPGELQGIIDKALKKNRDDRYPRIDEFRQDLVNIRGGSAEGISVSSATGLRRAPVKTNRRRRYIGGAIIVIAILGTAYLWNKMGPGPSSKVPSQSGAAPVSLEQVTFAAGVEEYPAFSPDGTRIAFSAEIDGYRHIVVKDLGTAREIQYTDGSVDNIQPAWMPDGDAIVYVRSNHRSGKLEPGDVFGEHSSGDIWILDLESRRTRLFVAGGFNPSFSSDGEWMAFDASLAGPRRIWVTDNRGRNPRQATFDHSEVVSHVIPRWSPDGTAIVFQNNGWTNSDIKVVDLTFNRIVSVTDDGFPDLNPVWSPSGETIYFSSYRSGGLNVWSIPVDRSGLPTGPLRQVTTGAGQDVQLAASRDGKRIAVAILRQNADLWRIPIDPSTGMIAGDPEQVVATTREDSRGRWSPDGKQIAFNSDRTGDMNIWIHSIEDGSARQVTRGPGGDYQPHWAPNGKRIVFFSSRSGNADIWSADVATGDIKQLTRGEALDINPFFSPDGTQIAYQSDHEGRREAWVMNADGKDQRQLTEVGASGHFLLWSRDSQDVIFRSPSGGELNVMRAPVNGGAPQFYGKVTGGAHMSFDPSRELIMDVVGHKVVWLSPLGGPAPEKVFESDDPGTRIDYPVWSPDGRWLLFDRVRPEGGDIWLIGGHE